MKQDMLIPFSIVDFRWFVPLSTHRLPPLFPRSLSNLSVFLSLLYRSRCLPEHKIARPTNYQLTLRFSLGKQRLSDYTV